MGSLCKLFNKINITGKILYNESLRLHSTFKIGGEADVYAVPDNIQSITAILNTANDNNIPLFVVGAGANILFSDNGYKGVVLDISSLNEIRIENSTVTAGAGTEISLLADLTSQKSLSGLHYFYGMPGQIGGSIYMNARCYGASVSDILSKAVYINREGILNEYKVNPDDFGYKISPFQNKGSIILSAEFELKQVKPEESNFLENEKNSFKEERKNKGHYLYPCAGSVFKNNRDFGKPSGAIIDSLGLRRLSSGDAMVSPEHANIIVNKGNAAASDVKKLVDIIQEKVFKAYGFLLEKEILYIDES